MMNVIKKEKKYLLILFGLITLIALMCFLPSLLKGVPITFGTDIKPQWFEFYTEFKNLIRSFIKERQLPFYSWNLFLGNNFWASKGYYLIGDIYNYIDLLLYNIKFKCYVVIKLKITELKKAHTGQIQINKNIDKY